MHTLIPVLIFATFALESQTSWAESDLYSDRNPYVWVAHSVTPNGRARVIITKTKHKSLLAKSQRPFLQVDDTDTDYYDELPDIQVGYRRPELVDQPAKVDGDISDEIKIRLALARMKALDAYAKKWG